MNLVAQIHEAVDVGNVILHPHARPRYSSNSCMGRSVLLTSLQCLTDDLQVDRSINNTAR